MTQEAFAKIAPKLPQEPGIYKYYGADEQLLYVGKAKDLRKRVSSYFTPTFTSYKTHELVKKITRIEFTIVDSEQDAFLLENALIKQYHPRYNILLKDDKTYPFIVIKKEPFPRVFLTRRKYQDGSEYIGPFTSVGRVRALLELVKRMIPLRTCTLNLAAKQIEKKQYKVCLEYHLGNCAGPCENKQSEKEYTDNLSQVKNIIKGNLHPVFSILRKQLKEATEQLRFEDAAQIQNKIRSLEAYKASSVIVGKLQGNLDVFSILRDGSIAYVNYLMVQHGTIVQTHTVQLETRLEETDEEILIFAIANLRSQFNSQAMELIVPFTITYPQTDVQIIIPKAGEKKKLLELSEKNVNYFKQEIRQKKIWQPLEKTPEEKKRVLHQLQQLLQLPNLPQHIECFDNSHFQGSFPVSAMVCFLDGQPSKQNYRHYHVKSVTGIDDFATMREVVYRRYKRLIEENTDLPQLVIIDGGKGQLNAALESIELLELKGKMTIVGLAKNEEEIFFAGDSQSIKLPWNSDALKLIRLIRDEVHRFGISFHRNTRSKKTFSNELEKIPGIGSQSAQQLLRAFKSVKKVQQQSSETLEKVIGKSKAALIVAYFNRIEQK
ncbi:MAG: excinuclease ABC subunit C [Chitinophagia bacterium]|nr:excinuclease ABC subunit C [Chitinophagia bacterium]